MYMFSPEELRLFHQERIGKLIGDQPTPLARTPRKPWFWESIRSKRKNNRK